MSRDMKESEIGWIGKMPRDWDVLRFKFLHNGLNTGMSLDKKYWSQNENDFVFYTAGLEPIRTSYKGFPENKYTGENDLLLSRNGTPYVYIPKQGACYTDHIIRAALKENVNRKYIRYSLQHSISSVVVDSVSLATWSASLWNEQAIGWPSDKEQCQIVSFLDRKCFAIDTAIEKTKKSIEKLEEYKKAVITKAVTKGLDPNAKMKDSGVEWIGEVPETWDIIKTKYLFRILKRIAGKEGFDVISITQRGLKVKDIRTNEGQLAENYSNYQFVFPGDFAMNHMDLLTGWVDLSVLSGVTSPDYRVFRRIKESTNNDYYKYLFQSLYFNKIYYGKAQGVAEVGRKRLQAPVFKEIKLPYPPVEEQAKIAIYIQDKCFSINALITKKQEAISKWEEYKKSLIYYAVTGKIDCRNEVI